MKPGADISIGLKGLEIIHHNKPKLSLAKHSHPEHHVILPLRGKVLVKTGDREWSCSPGRLLFLPSGIPHAFDSGDEGGERLIYLLKPAFHRRLPKEAALATADPLLRELSLHLLLRPVRPRAKGALVETLGLLFEESLANAASEVDARARARDPRVRKALDLIEVHYREELRIPKLAKLVGLSERSLTRLFVKEVGQNPKQVLTRLRVDEAQRLLSSSDRAVTDIALDVGFQSLSSFFAAFRQRTGHLPSEYRSAF